MTDIDEKVQQTTEKFDAEEFALEEVILHRLMRLDATIHGLTFGLGLGLLLFVATIFLVLKGGDVVGPNLSLLGEFFIGYSVTWGGAFVGLFYGFVAGFVGGYAIATLYNWILDWRESRLKTAAK